MSWNEGYVSAVEYTHGYYRDLAPTALELALLLRGQAPRLEAPLRYLELGYGQGVSLNVHAAATVGEYWGTDFNPAHASNAKSLADTSGANVIALDDSFGELAGRSDLPQFDVIALHGIWSWISDENRQQIVAIARNHLKVGGIFYVSYNAQPGWAPSGPIRELLHLHAEHASSGRADPVAKVEAALAFVSQLQDAGASYFAANKTAARRFAQIQKGNRRYLAHEYLNANWAPLPFSTVADQLKGAKLDFGASSNLLEQVDAIQLTPAQQELLAGLASPILRETVRDYCVNQQFRKDIWIKGLRPLSKGAQAERLREKAFVLTSPRSEVPGATKTSVGEVTLQPTIYEPLLDLLAAREHRPVRFRDIENALPNVSFARLAQALTVLGGMGHVAPSQSEVEIEAVRSRCDTLNGRLMDQAMDAGAAQVLASPVLGAGVGAQRFEQLFLRSLRAGRAAPEDWAAETWRILQASGERLSRDGKPICDEAENLAQLQRQARAFADNRLPMLKALLMFS